MKRSNFQNITTSYVAWAVQVYQTSPRSLAGKGIVDVKLTVAGETVKIVTITVK